MEQIRGRIVIWSTAAAAGRFTCFAGAPPMRRRTVLVLLAASMLQAPHDVVAQPASGMAKIGMLFAASQAGGAVNLGALRQGMRELGHVEGKTFVLEIRYGDTQSERLTDLARDLVSLKPNVIVTTTDPAVAAIKKQTSTIPIVMTAATDPVGTGLVANLGRPGGNVTGLSTRSSELGGKRLELLREAVPGFSRLAYLWNPDVRGGVLDYKEMDSATRALRIQLQSVEASRSDDLDRAFSAIAEQRAQALIVQGPNPVTFSNRARIAGFALKHRLPSMYTGRAFVEAGGLMSYGASGVDLVRRAAAYVDKILKGAKPADLPIEQPTKFELIIKVKTAKALSLTIPQSLLLRADQVIQ
jgi:putative tryptophan/tyrosine transport system substrate-binding protein